MAAFLVDLSGSAWGTLLPGVVLIAIASTLLGLAIAVAASEVFEAHTLSYDLDFSMLILFCVGLFLLSLWNIRRKWIL
jgi:ABC-2 type transport system permease protein